MSLGSWVIGSSCLLAAGTLGACRSKQQSVEALKMLGPSEHSSIAALGVIGTSLSLIATCMWHVTEKPKGSPLLLRSRKLILPELLLLLKSKELNASDKAT